MGKPLEDRITTEITSILCHVPTSTELAEWYLKERPSRNIKVKLRNDIKEIISGFELIEGKQDLIDELAEAHIHFVTYIHFESGGHTGGPIERMLLSSEKVNSKIAESIKALEIVSGMPLSVGTKTELMAYTQFLCNSCEIIYLKHSQYTALQELCERLPEAIKTVTYFMGKRPFARAAHGGDLLYQHALTKVIHTLLTGFIPTSRGKAGVKATYLVALTAGILNALYSCYPSFPTSVEDVKNALRKDKNKIF